MTVEQEECIQFIAMNYGKQSQVDVAIGECGELITALTDYRRGRNQIPDIVDELADVSIMIEQLKTLFDCRIQTDARIEYKIKRQLQRIGEEHGRSKVDKDCYKHV